jgi:hypothetical protein
MTIGVALPQYVSYPSSRNCGLLASLALSFYFCDQTAGDLNVCLHPLPQPIALSKVTLTTVERFI